MHIAILTFQGFNELDSLIAFGVLNRIKKPDWRVTLCCPDPEVTSMNGVTLKAQSLIEEATTAEAVVVGSGIKTREVVEDPELLHRIKLDPAKQLIAAQCSGTLILAKLGLVEGVPARTEGLEAASSALHYVAPVGEKEAYVASAMKHIAPYL